MPDESALELEDIGFYAMTSSKTRAAGFGIDVVNFLNQTGASACIRSASLAEDLLPFRNYLTSGTYRRPFTIEFALQYLSKKEFKKLLFNV